MLIIDFKLQLMYYEKEGDNMFYELKHSATTDYFMKANGKNYEFPAHIQECFELIVVTSGELNITLNKNSLSLKKGEAVLIFPNIVHSMLPSECEFVICIFSPLLVTAYYSKISNLLPDNPIFAMPQNLLDILIKMDKESSILAKKGFLYLLCDCFDKNRTYTKQKDGDYTLLIKILHYIETNYKKECTLKSLSENIGYDYTYVSRIFKDLVGLSFNNYVNYYRLNNACYLFENTKHSITNCALESGYTSIRSFNRNFKNQYGITPSEYAQKLKNK